MRSMSAGKRMDLEKNITIVSFLLVPFLLLLLFSYYPAVKLFQFSFAEWNGIDPQLKYVGFDNYAEVLSDPSMRQVAIHMIAYILMMFVQVALGLYLAIILDGAIKGRNLFRAAIFMPYILNTVAVVYIFNYLYSYEHSPINALLNVIGLDSIRFIHEGFSVNLYMALIGMWQYVGFNMVIFLAGLQSIPQEQYEAAKIDGANFYHKVRFITLPSIKRTISISLMLGINGALQAYVQALLITPGGGPDFATETFITKTLRVAQFYQKFGKASAMGVLMFCFIILIIVLQNRLLKERTD